MRDKRAKGLEKIIGSLLLAVGLACGGSSSSTKVETVTNTDPTGISLKVSSATLTAGKSGSLTATFEGARSATVDHGIGAVVSGVPVTIAPVADTTYTLTVTGVNLQVSTKTVSVSVTPAAAINQFGIGSATGPATLQVGYGFTGTIVPTFAGGDGSIDGGIGPVTSGQAYPVGPLTSNQVYNLTVTNALGDSVTSAVKFTVSPVTIGAVSPANPICRLGASMSFSATVSGALVPGITWSASAGTMNAGSGLWVAPGTAGNVTITATANANPAVSVSTIVTVINAPFIVSFQASPNLVTVGGSAMLTPVFADGVGVIPGITNNAVSGQSYPTGPLVAAKTFNLNVTNGIGETVTAATSVGVGSMSISGITPANMAVDLGGSIPFTATVSGAADPSITWSASAGTMNPTTGVWMAPNTPQTVTITATSNQDPTKMATTTINVISGPSASLVAGSLLVLKGDTTTLTPYFTGGAGTVDGGVGTVVNGQSYRIGPLNTDSSFTLTVKSQAGQTATSSVAVKVESVAITGINPKTGTPVNTGTQVPFTATVTGALDASVTWSASIGTINAATGIYTAPGFACQPTITATSVADPTVSASVSLVVVGGPTISSFTASATNVAGGQGVNLLPVFAGGTGTIDHGIGSVVSGQSYPTGALLANVTYTLTVTSLTGETLQSKVIITVSGITLGAIVPGGIAVTTGSQVTFSVQVFGAVNSGVVWGANAGFMNQDTGAWTAPGSAQTVTITAVSVVDPTKTASTTINVVSGPVINSFTAANTSLLQGGSTTLTANFSGGTGFVNNGVGAVVNGQPITTGPMFTSKTFNLVVTNAANATASAQVTVNVSAVSIGAITPAEPTQTVGSTVSFQAAVTGSVDTSISWLATAGTINPVTGVWTAPATPGTVTISAVSNAAPGQVATTTVVVVAAPAITAFTVDNNNLLYKGTAMLHPVFTGGTASIDQGIGVVQSGVAYASSALTGNTTFTLKVTNLAGDFVTATINVEVASVALGPINPGTPVKSVNATVNFTASIGGTADPTLIWAATAGSMNTSTGVWTAPNSAQTVTISVTSLADPSKSQMTTVNVVSLPQITGFSAASQTVLFAGSTYLYPNFTGGNGTVDHGVGTVLSGSSISTGAVTAPTIFTLTVTNPAGDSTTQTVTVTPQTVSVSPISPNGGTVSVGGNLSFTATVANSADPTVNWSSTAGTWSGNTWTAPGTAGAVTITATSNADPTKATSVNVNVVALAAIQSFTASSTNLAYGAGTNLLPVFSGGTGVIDWGIGPVTSGGAFPTGALTSGRTYTLTVTNSAGTATTGQVALTVSNVSIGAISPAGSSVTAGALAQFSVTVSGAFDSSVTWAATAGTMNGSNGNWTAPSTPQVVTITAYSNADNTQKATTTVTVVPAATISTFVSGSTPLYGGSTTLTAVFTGASGSIDQGVGAVTSSVGVPSGAINGNKVFTLTVLNSIGTPVTRQLTVTSQAVAVGSISPANSKVTTGKTQSFAASVTGAVDTGLTWSATGGTWSGSTWAAPSVGTYTITATSTADGTTYQSTTVTVVAAPTGSIAPSTVSPLYGATVVLTPTFAGGTAVVGTAQGASNLSNGPTNGVGITSAAITGSTTFWIRVTNTAGDFFDASTATIVPQSVSVAAISPATPTVTAGHTVVFSSSVSGASNTAITWSSNGGSWSGSTWTAPAVGTYTITATAAANGSTSQSTTVNVIPAPTASISATASPLYGGTSTVTPNFTGGTAVVGTYVGGSNLSSSATSGQGITSGAIISGTTFYVRVTNAAGDYVDANSAVVTPQTVVVSSVTPAGWTVTTGGNIVFNASVTGAVNTGITWSANGGSWSGSTWTAPGVGTYNITATAAANWTTAKTTTAVVVAAPTGSIAASTTTPLYGATVVLTPTFGSGTAVVGSAQGASNLSSSPTNGVGITSGAITSPTAFWIRVTNAAGDFVDANSGTVTPQTVVVGAVTPSNPSVTAGHTINFSSSVSGAANTAVTWSSTGGSWSGSTWTAPGAGTYTVTATAAANGSTSQSTTVTVYAVPTASVTASSSPLYGGTVTVTPTFTGGTAVVGTSPGGSNVYVGASSGVGVTSGAITGPTTFYIRVTNPMGDFVDANSAVVTPQTVAVSALTPAGATVTAGDSLVFSATVTGAVNPGVTWSASGGSWSGSTWTAPGAGTYTVTATAAANGSTSNNTTVTVVAAPTVTSFYASPTTINVGNSSTLTWTTGGGTVSVAISPTVGTVSGSGNRSVSPTSSTTYTLTATNAAGATATGTATVGVNTVLPVCDSFTVSQDYADGTYYDYATIQGTYDSWNLYTPTGVLVGSGDSATPGMGYWTSNTSYLGGSWKLVLTRAGNSLNFFATEIPR